MSEREIKPDEVRVGDTIRLENTTQFDEYGHYERYAFTVPAIDADTKVEFTGGSVFYLVNYDTITLLSRPLPKHKYAVGQKVKGKYVTAYDVVVVWQGEIRVAREYNSDDKPIYRCIDDEGFERWSSEDQLTPVPEEVWEPKWGEFVKHGNHKLLIARIDTGDAVKYYKYYALDKYGTGRWLKLSELSPWEEAQP